MTDVVSSVFRLVLVQPKQPGGWHIEHIGTCLGDAGIGNGTDEANLTNRTCWTCTNTEGLLGKLIESTWRAPKPLVCQTEGNMLSMNSGWLLCCPGEKRVQTKRNDKLTACWRMKCWPCHSAHVSCPPQVARSAFFGVFLSFPAWFPVVAGCWHRKFAGGFGLRMWMKKILKSYPAPESSWNGILSNEI